MKHLKSFGRLAGVLAIGVTAYAFAKFQGGFVSWFIFYMLVPFVAYSILLYLYPMRDIRVERHIEDRHIMRNGQAVIRLIIKRKWPFPLPYIILADKRIHAKQTRTVRQMALIGFRRTYEYSYVLKDLTRGEYTLPAVEIELVDFFNWIRKKEVFAVHDTFLVYPNVTGLMYQSAAGGTSGGQRLSAYTPAKDATTPSSVREYAPGDRISLIHWKSFARTSKLMTKEFDEQRSEQYTVLLDCGKSEAFEDAVEFAASIVVSAREHQAKLTFMTASSQPSLFPRMQSADQTRQALVHLAKIHSDDAHRVLLPTEKAVSEDALLVVTAALHLDFIRRVLHFYRNPSGMVCFVMITDEEEVKRMDSVVSQVKQLGVKVRFVHPSDRAVALKEAVAV
ncbi:hypothetical protein SporoP37_06560 [Sporosarcina sp. P37]|uniref:DUF58 domain-containing protein n=1 Tax=unclassified Sporosarcina TaxID=2647733 RepID=UPI000A17AB1C|nr:MULTISPECIES: DUF58 domain-containing protein [unclassified Sporosarcina]ARK24361.1 hypothetical protein SporoP37_06560 [Sporosarcina sp. P37]PID17440.1 DUF58 domain-containing protein [Sporosarcina sp. P35]